VTEYTLGNADIVTGSKVISSGSLAVSGSMIAGFKPSGCVIDLKKKSYVYPALINVHDHMKGNYLPRVGPKGDSFYVNWSFWDADLKSSPVYEERSNISVENLYFLSAYKNLFSGVATVNDHFPHEINEPFIPRLPIRVIREYCLAHECSSYDLRWGKGIETEHALALKNDWPFITHLEEGFDPEAQDGLAILERLKCLDKHDVFIHCIGFSDEDILKTARAGASVSWCPASNIFMFNATCKIKKIMKAGINVALGTDSTHTGSENILAEMKYARLTYRQLYGEDLPAKSLFDMVTINPAKAFRMQDTIGSLEQGKKADIVILRARTDDHYENFAGAAMDDIEFLSVDGIPVYADERFFGLLPETGYEDIKVAGRKMKVKGTPKALYKSIREAVGFKKTLEYLPFDC